jgi:hypothetical protein
MKAALVTALALAGVALAGVALAEDWQPPASGELTQGELDGVLRYFEARKKGADHEKAVKESKLAPGELSWTLDRTAEVAWLLVVAGISDHQRVAAGWVDREDVWRTRALEAWRTGLRDIAKVTTSVDALTDALQKCADADVAFRASSRAFEAAGTRYRATEAAVESLTACFLPAQRDFFMEMDDVRNGKGDREEAAAHEKTLRAVQDAAREAGRARIESAMKERNDRDDERINAARRHQAALRAYYDLRDERLGGSPPERIVSLERGVLAAAHSWDEARAVLESWKAYGDEATSKRASRALDALPEANTHLVRSRSDEIMFGFADIDDPRFAAFLQGRR